MVPLSVGPDQGSCDVGCLEDWVFRVSQVAAYLELLVSEGLGVVLSSRPPVTLLPPCRETPWSQLKCLLDLPTLMFLAPQVRRIDVLRVSLCPYVLIIYNHITIQIYKIHLYDISIDVIIISWQSSIFRNTSSFITLENIHCFKDFT